MERFKGVKEMEDAIKTTVAIMCVTLAVILGIAIAFSILGLIYWAAVAFIIWAFGINFVWTYWHGVATAVLISILSGGLKIRVKKED